MTVDSSVRYGREFGGGTVIGKDRNFFNKPLDEQVKAMGWSHACPVIDQVVKDFGAEWTLRRYAECNFVFGLIKASAKELNPQLYSQLTTSVSRRSSEPVGVFTEYTPESHKKQMSPMSTPWGYALPRVVIEQMGRGEGNIERTPERMNKALNIVDEMVKTSTDPLELVVKIAAKVADEDADPQKVLAHLLAAGVLAEENTQSMFGDILAKMKDLAPDLLRTYRSMTPAQRQDIGMIDV